MPGPRHEVVALANDRCQARNPDDGSRCEGVAGHGGICHRSPTRQWFAAPAEETVAEAFAVPALMYGALAERIAEAEEEAILNGDLAPRDPSGLEPFDSWHARRCPAAQPDFSYLRCGGVAWEGTTAASAPFAGRTCREAWAEESFRAWHQENCPGGNEPIYVCDGRTGDGAHVWREAGPTPAGHPFLGLSCRQAWETAAGIHDWRAPTVQVTRPATCGMKLGEGWPKCDRRAGHAPPHAADLVTGDRIAWPGPPAEPETASLVPERAQPVPGRAIDLGD